MMTFIAAIIEPNLKFFYLKFNKKRLDWIKTYRLDHGVIENPSFEPLFVTSDLSECQLSWGRLQQ